MDRMLALQKSYRKRKKTNNSPLVFATAVLSKKGRTKLVSDRLKELLLPASNGALTSEFRTRAKMELTMVHFQLELHKRDYGVYPFLLSELIPKYISEIPKDRFSENKNFHYWSNGKKFMLYSVGEDGINNQGKSYSEGYDDLVIKSWKN